MKEVDNLEFFEFLNKHPMAAPDGFGLVGSLMQSRWIENGKEIARDSWDSQGHIYEITE